MFIGGFHLSKLDTQGAGAVKLKEIAGILMMHDTKYYTAHCTGVEQFEYMKRFMPRLNYLSTGGRVEAAV